MSRLDAALRRASSGAVQEQEPLPEDLIPADLAPHLSNDFSAAADDPDDAPPVKMVRAETPTRRFDARILDTAPDRQSEDEAAEEQEPAHFHNFSSRHLEKLVISRDLPPVLREQYRRVGATLHHAQAESGLKTLMITSAVPEEGKTLTAANIALTLSESYQRRVLLIDADLRRPSLDDIFDVPKVFGLSEMLTSGADRKVSLIEVSRYLSFLPAGTPDSDPMSKLTSDRMQRLIEEARSTFEWVIVDTPPVGILTDAKLLGSMVDAALLVIRAGRTPASLVQRAVDALGRDRILGVVLNRVEMQPEHSGSYYGAYYYASARRR